jgi:hypothetical protein
MRAKVSDAELFSERDFLLTENLCVSGCPGLSVDSSTDGVNLGWNGSTMDDFLENAVSYDSFRLHTNSLIIIHLKRLDTNVH